MNRKECFLLLGANGFIGKQLTRKLSEHTPIKAYDRQFFDDFPLNDNVTCITGNLMTEADFESLLKDVTTVIHFAGMAIPSDDTGRIETEIQSDLLPTVHLLEAMRQYQVPKIVFASSAGVIYGETGDTVNTSRSRPAPACSYGIIKQTIESYLKLYARNYGIRCKIARMSNPYGMGQDVNKIQGLIPILIRNLMQNQPIHVFGDAEKMRDYIYLPDLIEGLEKVVYDESDETVFNLGFGQYHTIQEVIDLIEEKVGRQFCEIIREPERKCDLKKSLVDFDEAHRLLHWYPKVELREGIALLCQRMLG